MYAVAMAGQCTTLPYVMRSGWGARPPKEAVQVIADAVPFVVIHHSYEPKACCTRAECEAAMVGMQDFHQINRGWNDIGYKCERDPIIFNWR